MSTVENRFCSLEEYVESEDFRLDEAELSVDGLYLFMARLDADEPTSAGKLPARVTGLRSDEYLHYVDLRLLTSDFSVYLDTKAVFNDGYWQQQGSKAWYLDDYPVITGYLVDYGSGLGDDLSSMIFESLPEDRLVVGA